MTKIKQIGNVCQRQTLTMTWSNWGIDIACGCVNFKNILETSIISGSCKKYISKHVTEAKAHIHVKSAH